MRLIRTDEYKSVISVSSVFYCPHPDGIQIKQMRLIKTDQNESVASVSSAFYFALAYKGF